MNEAREEMYEVLVLDDDHKEDYYKTYTSLEQARKSVALLKEEGFETELYKLTVFEELIDD